MTPLIKIGKRLDIITRYILDNHPEDEWVISNIIPMFLEIIKSTTTLQEEQLIINKLNDLIDSYEFRYNSIFEIINNMNQDLTNKIKEAVKKALMTPKGQFMKNADVKPEVVAEKAKDKEGLMYAIATNIAKYGKPQTPKGAKPAHLTKGQMAKKEKAVMGLKKSLEENKEHYMFFQNLKNIKQMTEDMLKLDPSTVDSILTNGHDWAADHIATSKDDVEEVHNFLMSKESQSEIDEKKLSPAQQKIAKAAPPTDKITGADFAALRANKK